MPLLMPLASKVIVLVAPFMKVNTTDETSEHKCKLTAAL